MSALALLALLCTQARSASEGHPSLALRACVGESAQPSRLCTQARSASEGHPSLALRACVGESAPPSRLAVIQKAPGFALTDQSGKAVGSASLKGKVLLVSFVFTTCNGSCPATTHRMGLVQRELKAHGLLAGDRVRLLSITLDPKRDTAEVLRHYMRLYDADPASWSFLTGPPAEVAKVIAAWGMWAKPTANGQLDHPSRVFLVDRRGDVREIYNLEFLRPAWVAEDVRLLLSEKE